MAKQEAARKRYRSDLTDEQWGILEPLLPPPRTQHGGTPRRVDMLGAKIYAYQWGRLEWEGLGRRKLLSRNVELGNWSLFNLE